ncbi:MAG: hypothetical protein ACYSUM_24280 [Planctomycetota bacterium]|jgi:hypothetical protein
MTSISAGMSAAAWIVVFGGAGLWLLATWLRLYNEYRRNLEADDLEELRDEQMERDGL